MRFRSWKMGSKVLSVFFLLSAPQAGARMTPQIRKRVAAYPQTLKKINEGHQKLKSQWKKARTQAEKARVRRAAREFVKRSILEDVVPAWTGTPWYMGPDDDASLPHQEGKRISCSMFVTAVLQNIGLKLDNRRRWANSRALYIQRSLAPETADLHRYYSIAPSEFAKKLLKLNAGLYIVGLNCHVGFIHVTKNQAWFIHSNYVDPEEGVTTERVETSQAIANSQPVGYWVTPLFQDDRLIEYWLEGRDVPIQRKSEFRANL